MENCTTVMVVVMIIPQKELIFNCKQGTKRW
jgi:hypothetical protein